MAIADPFAIPEIPPAEVRLPPLPLLRCTVRDEAHLRQIAELVVQRYQQQGRWKPIKSINEKLFAALRWADQNLECWPPCLIRALAYALGVYDVVDNRRRALSAVMADGKDAAIRQAHMEDQCRLPSLAVLQRPTASSLSQRLSRFPPLVPSNAASPELALTANIQRARVSPSKIEHWRGLASYEERRKVAQRLWLRYLRESSRGDADAMAKFDEAIRSEMPVAGDAVDDRAAEWAVASGKLSADERLVLFTCLSKMNRGGRMLTEDQTCALAVALGLASIKPDKARAAGT